MRRFHRFHRSKAPLAIVVLALATTGCWHSTTVHDPNDGEQYDESYGHTDLKIITKKLVDAMVAAQPLAGRKDRVHHLK